MNTYIIQFDISPQESRPRVEWKAIYDVVVASGGLIREEAVTLGHVVNIGSGFPEAEARADALLRIDTELPALEVKAICMALEYDEGGRRIGDIDVYANDPFVWPENGQPFNIVTLVNEFGWGLAERKLNAYKISAPMSRKEFEMSLQRGIYEKET